MFPNTDSKPQGAVATLALLMIALTVSATPPPASDALLISRAVKR